MLLKLASQQGDTFLISSRLMLYFLQWKCVVSSALGSYYLITLGNQEWWLFVYISGVPLTLNSSGGILCLALWFSFNNPCFCLVHLCRVPPFKLLLKSALCSWFDGSVLDLFQRMQVQFPEHSPNISWLALTPALGAPMLSSGFCWYLHPNACIHTKTHTYTCTLK